MVFLEIKITVFTCLPGTEECDSFPERLDLALAPNKTNEAVNSFCVNCSGKFHLGGKQ